MNDFYYCQTCVLPNTRPNLVVHSDGTCECPKKKRVVSGPPVSYPEKFAELIEEVSIGDSDYDCVIPVSGGKDSTWQVVKALEFGLRPICVTWKSPGRNAIGNKNLQNLVSLGVDHIDFTVNPLVERKFIRKAFEKLGSPAIPMHMAIHALALQTAIRFRTPLVIYGENSADEYGCISDPTRGGTLNGEWLRKHGVTGGTNWLDWVDSDLSRRDLSPYEWPSDDSLYSAGVRAVFLGEFFRWDPTETYKVALDHGFESATKPSVGIYKFADIDDSFLIAIHHYFKWFKYGFTRSWDNISLEIRAGRLSRGQGLALLSELGDERPAKAIEEFCNYMEFSEEKFDELIEKFRNPNIWKRSPQGVWRIENFLLPDWSW